MQDIKHIIHTLQTNTPTLLPETPFCAAVMVILLVDDAQQIHIVITKRAANLPTYAGQYCFPGGFRDSPDEELFATAVRETMEELTIAADHYQYLGQLNDLHDHYGNLVRPFVVLMKQQQFLESHQQSQDEIDEVYYFPFNKLANIKDDPCIHHITTRRPAYSYTDGKVFVFGLTAAILVNLYKVVDEGVRPEWH